MRSERAGQWWEGVRPQPAPVFSDRAGLARFADLAQGTWTVTVEANELLSFEAGRVSVRRGETTSLPARLTRPASLAGAVHLADGGPAAGLTVTARGPAEGVGTTGADGSFVIGDLPPGRYRVEVTHEGFENAVAKETVALREGESRGGVALTVTPRAPELAFVLLRDAFGLDQPIKIGLRSFRVGLVDLALYEIPAARLLDPERDFRALVQGGDTTGLARVENWQKVTAEGPPWSWREEELTLPQGVLPGAYLLAGRAGTIERRVIFFVTDLSLLVKRSKTQVLVSAASLKSGRPIGGAEVTVVAAPPGGMPGMNWTMTRGAAGAPHAVTDERGIASLALAGASRRVRIVAASESNGISVVDVPLTPAADQSGDQLFLYTDRPIYRPGQTVYWKAFARKATDSGYAMPDASGVSVSLTGPDGAGVEVAPPRLSPRGSMDGAIALPRELPLGDWSLRASVGRAGATASLAVEEYRKPEFRVEVTPDREVYVSGDEVRFAVKAGYFFGAPVFGAQVRYHLFETRLGPDALAGEDESDEGDGGYGRVLKSGEARTDVDGTVALAFQPLRTTYDRRLTLEVEVADAAGRQVAGRGSAVMGRGLFTVTVKPGSWLVNAGNAIPIEVATRDHAGRAVSAAVTVTLDQDAWNPLERRYVRSTRALAEATVTTDTLGHGFVSLTPAPARSGRLDVRARAEDAKGNVITAASSVWVYDAKVAEYAYRYPALEARADRERYQPGDSARILVNTDIRNATLLAAVEGRDIEDVQVLALRGNTALVTFPMHARYAPNVFVTVHVRKNREVQSRTLELKVAAERHDLKIALAPDRDAYRPGDEARIGVATTDGRGRPVPAELSLGVVDEAIYSLRPDRTPDPHDVFYGRRPNWVATAVSFPTLYFGGADKGGREEPRKDFRDVAFWEPSVLTGADGKASVSFRWPDNLTTWRITGRGATDSTLVGKAVAKTLVTKEVVARLAGPRAFVAGDEAVLVSVVNNRARAPLTGVEESLEAKGPAKLAGRPSRRSDLPAGGESRGEWPVAIARELPADADSIVSATFVFRARAKSDADALEVGTPVLPRAVALQPHGAGVLTGAGETLVVQLPADLVRPGSEVVLELSPSPAALALGALQYLAAYPWGCTEQTANAVLPASAMLAAARRAGFTLPGWEDPAKRLAPPLERLRALQSDDGGWGWWREGGSDPYLTALALDALAQAASLGYGAEASRHALLRATSALPRQLAEVRSGDGEAYVLAHLVPLLALPDAQQYFPELKPRLEDLALATFGARERLGAAGLALAVQGHAALGRAAEAKALLDLLMGRAVKDGAGLHWEGSEEGWFGEGIETTAYALSALVAVAPADPRAAEVVRWLAARRRGDHWRSTRTTGPVAIALAGYLAAHPAEAKPDHHLRVDWNGARLLERDVKPADAFAPGARVRVAGAKLKPGENRLALAKEGAGSLYWSWQAKALVPSPGPDTSPEQRLRVTREYFHAERTADRRGRPRWLVTPLAEQQGFHVGEQVLVRLTLHASRALDHLIVEDPRPAGFEVDQLLPEGAEWPWGTHAEARDTRGVFFLERADEGDTAIEYLLRPEMAGSLTALPASAGAMYDPDLLVRTGEARVRVEAR